MKLNCTPFIDSHKESMPQAHEDGKKLNTYEIIMFQTAEPFLIIDPI